MRSTAERMLWSGALIAAAGTALMFAPPEMPDLENVQLEALLRSPARADTRALVQQAAELMSGNPFRLNRRPVDLALVADDPDQTSMMDALPPPPPPRPIPVVTGVIGGPHWEALVEGIPGEEGSVLLRAGDAAGEFRAVRISRDTVIMETADTVYVLVPRRPWN